MSILRSFSDKFFARFRGRTSVQVENTLLKLHFCRTLPICSVESTSAILASIDTMFTNSCGDRHCPLRLGGSAQRLDRKDRSVVAQPSNLLSMCLYTAGPIVQPVLAIGSRCMTCCSHQPGGAIHDSVSAECKNPTRSLDGAPHMEPTTGFISACACDRTRQWSIADGQSWTPVRMTQPRRNKPAPHCWSTIKHWDIAFAMPISLACAA